MTMFGMELSLTELVVGLLMSAFGLLIVLLGIGFSMAAMRSRGVATKTTLNPQPVAVNQGAGRSGQFFSWLGTRTWPFWATVLGLPCVAVAIWFWSESGFVLPSASTSIKAFTLAVTIGAVLKGLYTFTRDSSGVASKVYFVIAMVFGTGYLVASSTFGDELIGDTVQIRQEAAQQWLRDLNKEFQEVPSEDTNTTEKPGEFSQWLDRVSETPWAQLVEDNTLAPWYWSVGPIAALVAFLVLRRLLRRNDASTSTKTKAPSLKKGEVWAIAIVVIVIVSAVLGVVYGFLVWVEAVPAIGTTTASAGAQCATSETLTTTLNQQGRSVTVCKGSDSLVVYLPPGTRPQIEWDPNFMANNLGYTSKYQATDFVRDGGRRGVLSGNSRDWVLDVSQDYQGKPSAFAQAGLTAVTVWVTPVRQ